MNLAYHYRLYPTSEQEILFAKTFGCVRFIYNKMLGDRLDYYQKTGKKLNNTPAQYKAEFPWLKEVDSLALANAQLNLNRAYHNFWKNPKHFGRPRFKSRKSGHFAYSTNNQKGSVRIEGGKIKLPKVGWVKLRQHRPLMPNSVIKTVAIRKTPSGKYYIRILIEYENQVLPIIPEHFLGLDFAMHGLYVASDEADAADPDFLRKAEKKLAKAQRILSRREKDSKNREKQRKRVAVLHEKVADQRRDFLHKKSRFLVDRYDALASKISRSRPWPDARRAINSALENPWLITAGGFWCRCFPINLPGRENSCSKSINGIPAARFVMSADIRMQRRKTYRSVNGFAQNAAHTIAAIKMLP